MCIQIVVIYYLDNLHTVNVQMVTGLVTSGVGTIFWSTVLKKDKGKNARLLIRS